MTIFVSEISLPVAGAAWASGIPIAEAGLNVGAILKDEVGLKDSDILKQPDEIGRKPNVLFMVDATAAMSFSTKSVMPTVVLDKDWTVSGRPGADWNATKTVYGYTVDDVIDMMKNATYGIGAMPAAWSGAVLRPERNLYGRDIDKSNNYVKRSKNIEEDLKLNGINYYAPFAKEDTDKGVRGVKEGYASQNIPLEMERTGSAPAAHVGAAHWDLDSKEIGTSKTTPIFPQGASEFKYGGNSKISDAKRFPYALIFQNPDYWEKGMEKAEVGSTFSSYLLVPNDSRMYQAKLALWRLLEDENALKGIRFGLASTYLPTTNDTNFCYDKDAGKKTPPYYKKAGGDHNGLEHRYDFSGMYKVSPFGTNVWTSRKFSGTTPGDHGANGKTDGKKQYKHGVLIQPISGQIRGYNAIHAQYYPMWQHKTVEPLYSSIPDKNKRIIQNYYKLLHRGSLLVPIREGDREWRDGVNGMPPSFYREKMSHADRIRQWINGFADLYNGKIDDKVTKADDNNRNNQYHYYKDPEIGVAGVFILPHAIYPDPRTNYGMTRGDYKRNIFTAGSTETKDGVETAIWYSHNLMNTDYEYNRKIFSTELEDNEAEIKSRFNAGSGEAAGSVLDFFSPPVGLYSSLSLSEVSYPIRSACEPNWLIVITTGQELKTTSNADYSYTTAQAIKNLYDATNKATKNNNRSVTTGALNGSKIYAPYEKVSMLKRKSGGGIIGKPEEIDLDVPIQTLVIGMVPKRGSLTNTAENAALDEMHLNLTKMAVAGQGGNPDKVTLGNMDTFDAQPYIASNSDELMKAINSAILMTKDSAVMQSSLSAPLISEALSDLDDGNPDMYSYNYKIMKTDQWEAEMAREVISTDKDGKLRFHSKWTIGTPDDTSIVPSGGNRAVSFWDPNSAVRYVMSANGAAFQKAAGFSASAVIPPNGKALNGVSTQDAFFRWLSGKDYSYANKAEYVRSRMLTDIGQGGIAMINDPAVSKGETLPGYRDWAISIKENGKKQAPILYAQTNDGLLRIIDPLNGGKEISAILPPPLMIPSRLASLKAGRNGDKWEWVNVTGKNSQKSYPSFTLDGSFQKRDFNLEQTGNQSGWGKYLLGTLGRGGNGLYMMNVSTHDNPEVMWYRENIGGKLASGQWSRDSGSTLIYSSADLACSSDLGYLKLGFNSPKPVMGVAPAFGEAPKDMRNYIALAGGVQSQVPHDLHKNGDEGATLLMIEPKDGSVIRAFTGSSLLDPAWRVGKDIQGAAPYMGMMVGEPVIVRSVKSPYLTGGIIASDNRGNIFRVYMEDEKTGEALAPEHWSIKTVATLQTDATKDDEKTPLSFSIPDGVAVGQEKGRPYMWIAGGTADAVARKNAGDANEKGLIRNHGQMIFSFMSNKSEDRGPLTRNGMKLINADIADSYFSPGSEEDRAFKGWYMNLKEAGQNSFREYVSAKPLLIENTLFIATFIQKNKIAPDVSSQCAPERSLYGDGSIYAVDIRTGKPTVWKGDSGNPSPKYITIKGFKIGSLRKVVKGDKIYIIANGDTLGKTDANPGEGTYWAPNFNGQSLVIPFKKQRCPSKLPPGCAIINYWIKK
ncbi:MAG: hypothetical protein LBG29_02395 [Synergistaceae bacterium]|nr:hypothetical protein [Synergistaceae bacterium]